ncbi:MAG TPA: cob(I)yrinic acid a,c-diamide adenosyltransferase [Planctomycetaceae bacterium]|nr:cob(I)yrinic acid a,c-diamide adenosyltransferase [Planctomycetaceae bacterium]HCD02912.1 cob(I)yrinic acid a,c-diamide adenosyltransferase [Planctomycetaceae bacterium]
MVYLDRIYTRSGDAGETSLGDGSRVPKTSRRIVAYGAVDELNAMIGAARAATGEEIAANLATIQNDLFDVGADLCVPEADGDGSESLRVTSEQVSWLETTIDTFTDRLEPLTSFVLPGGSPAAAALHQARTVCRRAEIEVLRLTEHETVNNQVVIYLNRLSDLLFVVARSANDDGRDDVLWVPGGQPK